MKRRTFLRGGLAAGLLSAGGCSVPRTVAQALNGNGHDDDPIKLMYNENPLGLCAAAKQAVIDGIVDANRYPDVPTAALVEAIAKKHSVDASNIVMGNGSTEALQMAVQVFGQEGTRFIQAVPTYEDVTRYAAPYNLEIVRLPLTSTYAHDIQRMKEEVAKSSGRTVIYFCQPNNPTGTITPSKDIDDWIKSAGDDVCFLMDEAYYEYAEPDPEYHSALPWIETHPNVVVFRTFSKVYGMAGLRLGYAVAHPDTAAKLTELQSVMNANHLALMAGMASLEDPNYLEVSVATNTAARKILLGTLDDLGLEHLPSHTNFVMHKIRGDQDQYRARMLEAGFMVGRNFPPMLEYSRLSLGTPGQMERFVETLRDFRSKNWV